MEDLGKLIVAKDFKKLSKVQNFAKSGHTGERDCKVTKKAKKLERNQEKDSERKTIKVTNESGKITETELKKMTPKS